MRLIIEMPWERDLSVNQMRFGASGGYRKKPHIQAWMNELSWKIYRKRHFYDGWPILSLPASILIAFRYPDKRRRDDHNYYKAICDAVAAGLGIDDKDIRIRTESVVVDRENPGFTITVTDEED